MSQFLQVMWDRCPIYVLGLCFSSFTSIMHQGDYPFSLGYSWLPCWILVDCMYWNLRASLLVQMVKNLPAAGDLGLILGREDPLENEMATHSSILAWRIPWMEEPGRLQSMGSQSETDWATSLYTKNMGFPGCSDGRVYLQNGRPGFDPCIGKIPWKGEWQPTPVFLPGESHGQRSLVGYSLWDHKELDTNTFLLKEWR